MNLHTRRNVLSALALAPLPALAAGGEKKDTGDTLNVELPNIILPVARGGVLMNYVFLTLEIRAGDFATSEFLRQRHFIVRDAVLKAASASPVAPGATRNSVDEASLIPFLTGIISRSGPRLRIASLRIKRAEYMRG